MREQSRAISMRPRSKRPPAESLGLEVLREFTPEQIDLDDLAQAMRGLLGEGSAPHPHLLSSRRRGSHVVGANDAS
jgi:hypothetical protein